MVHTCVQFFFGFVFVSCTLLLCHSCKQKEFSCNGLVPKSLTLGTSNVKHIFIRYGASARLDYLHDILGSNTTMKENNLT